MFFSKLLLFEFLWEMYASRRLRAWRGHLGREEVEVSQECRKRRIVFHPDDPPHSNLISVRESVGGECVAQYFFLVENTGRGRDIFFFFFSCSLANTHTQLPCGRGRALDGKVWSPSSSSSFLFLCIKGYVGGGRRGRREGQLFPLLLSGKTWRRVRDLIFAKLPSPPAA